MQIYQLFSVYDSKSEVFCQPLFHRARGEAIRAFSDAVNEKGHNFNKYPADFTLFFIGTYNDSTGIISPEKTPVSIGIAQEFLNPQLQLVNNA